MTASDFALTHFIRNKFRSDFNCVSQKYVCHLYLQIGQHCGTVFNYNQAKINRYQLISSCHFYLSVYAQQCNAQNPFTKLYDSIPFLIYTNFIADLLAKMR